MNMKNFLSSACIVLVAIYFTGCGKKPEEQSVPSTNQSTNTVTQKTNKLATFVQPKPKTNIGVKISSPKKTEQSEVKTTTQSVVTQKVNPVKVTPPPTPQIQAPQIQNQPQIDYASEQVETLKIRASNGDTGAQLELASRYLYGKGVEKNEGEAIQWLTMAASSGNPVAQNRLGLMYATGQSLQKDPTQAVYWYKLAAEQNHATAQNNLGIMYATGNGVEQNDIEAYKWLTIAGSRITNAILFRENIAKRMTPEQIEKAKQQAQEFMSRLSPQQPPSQ